MKWNKQIDKSQTSRNATYSSQVHTDLLLRFLLILCMCICYATRSSYARADRLAAMLLAQNLHVRADLPLGRQVFRYIVKKKRIEGRGLLDSRWIARQMDGWMYRQIDGWIDRQIADFLLLYLLFSTAHRLAATAALLAFLIHVHLLHYSLFLCTCRQTCCNVTGSPLARGQWLAAAPLAFLMLMHVHTDLLLRYLLVLRMAGRRAFYATCSSYA